MPPGSRVRCPDCSRLSPAGAKRVMNRVGTVLRTFRQGDTQMAHVLWDRRRPGGNRVLWSVPVDDLVLTEDLELGRGG